MMHPASREEERVVLDLARRAGKAILEVYASPFKVRFKGPDDPVTDADLRAQDIIIEGLGREFPHDGIISEERPVSEEAGRKPRVWYVDPLDGTGEFVARSGEFSVIIGLVEGGLPKLGAIYRPTEDMLYVGILDQAAWIVKKGVTGNEPGCLQTHRLILCAWPSHDPIVTPRSTRSRPGWVT